LHIGHLVLLKRSNFVTCYGSSGMVRTSGNPLKKCLKNANTLAHGGVHLVVLAHLQRRRSWRSFWRRLELKRRGDGPWIGILYLSFVIWINHSCGLCSPLN
jgi:hypothetical protein